MRPPARRRQILAGLCCLTATMACNGDGQSTTSELDGSTADISELPPDSVHERGLVFVSDTGAVVSPWIFGAATSGDSVVRSVRALWLRGGDNVLLLDSVWTMPAMRAPGRILPGGGLGVTAALGGSVERVMAHPASGTVQLQLDEPIAGWRVGVVARTLGLVGARLHGEGGTLTGIVLEFARSAPVVRPLFGDCGFLVARGDLAWVVESDAPLSAGDSLGSPGRLWASVRGEQRDWVALETRRAGITRTASGGTSRPQWSLSAPEADFRAELIGDIVVPSSLSAESETTATGGLPVASPSLVTVAGTVFFDGRQFAVRGVMTVVN